MDNHSLQQSLANVLWIGGATDAGKSTVAQNLAEQYSFQVYHYDQHDLPHHVQLSQKLSHVREFLEASIKQSLSF